MSEDQLLLTSAHCPWLIDGPLGIAVTPYVNYLRIRRYSEPTVNRYVTSVAHFAYWMRVRKSKLLNLDETLVNQFLRRHLPYCKCPKPCRHSPQDLRAALRHLLIVLRQAGLLPAPLIKESTPLAIELEEFRRYLIDTCGLAERTCRSRLEYIQKFLSHHFRKGPLDISRLTVKDIDSYIIGYAKLSHSSVSSIGSTLKAYFRFRASRGDQTQSLLAAVPHIANWSRTTIPKILTEEELEHVLQAFDVTTPMGQRNYAIARCLMDLGLRSIEVTNLSLSSLDWHEATITVSCGKGRKCRKLPLPARTGQAIARYLRHGRPQTSNRQLFVRHCPPYDAPISAAAIQKLIRRVFDRCHLDKNLGATHALRHTLATRLQRSGASLKEIADLLGHQDLQTTTIYARVDVQGLRAMALPWPGSSS